MDAITISNVSKSYFVGRGRRLQAISDLSLTIHQGEVFGFLGPNGAGKSTTIKSLLGQITLSSGKVLIFDMPASDPASRLRVGYLPENPAFYDFLSAYEYLWFVGKVYNMKSALIQRRIDEVLKLLELTDAAARPIRGYSKGMVQRLGLAQALLHDPDLYVLDEPMSGLDPLGRALVKQIIKDLRHRGKTVFFSTHITSDVEMICDRVGVIVHGRLQAVDRVSSILEQGESGYRVSSVTAQGASIETDISKEGLAEYVTYCATLGGSIVRIEPLRRDLESFFLDTVTRRVDEQLEIS